MAIGTDREDGNPENSCPAAWPCSVGGGRRLGATPVGNKSVERIKGSHRIYTTPVISARISVPVRGDGDLKRGPQRQIMKTARTEKSEL